jgi:hypothetical protein
VKLFDCDEIAEMCVEYCIVSVRSGWFIGFELEMAEEELLILLHQT